MANKSVLILCHRWLLYVVLIALVSEATAETVTDAPIEDFAAYQQLYSNYTQIRSSIISRAKMEREAMLGLRHNVSYPTSYFSARASN